MTNNNQEQFKSGYVAIIGRPNVGKSTLMNQVIGQKIAITSGKPQTTRNRIHGVFTDERGQIVFLDTPGLQKARNELGKFMEDEAEGTFADADVVLWLVEPTTHIGGVEQHILELMQKVSCPIVLAINKCDTVANDKILASITAYSNSMEFADIVPISAETGKGTDELMKVLFSHLPEGPKYFDEETVTDETMRHIVEELVREKTLRFLSDEIPHGIAVMVTAYKEQERITDIAADIICERDSHKGIIIGRGGSMLKKIGTAARKDIEEMIDGRVNLRLFVKVRKDWRNNESILKNLGYGEHK